jgi:hypothetical protein
MVKIITLLLNILYFLKCLQCLMVSRAYLPNHAIVKTVNCLPGCVLNQ